MTPHVIVDLGGELPKVGLALQFFAGDR